MPERKETPIRLPEAKINQLKNSVRWLLAQRVTQILDGRILLNLSRGNRVMVMQVTVVDNDYQQHLVFEAGQFAKVQGQDVTCFRLGNWVDEVIRVQQETANKVKQMELEEQQERFTPLDDSFIFESFPKPEPVEVEVEVEVEDKAAQLISLLTDLVKESLQQ